MPTSPEEQPSNAVALERFNTEHCDSVAKLLAQAASEQDIINRKMCRDNEFPSNYIPIAVTRYYTGAQQLPKDSEECAQLVTNLDSALDPLLRQHLVRFSSFTASVEWDESIPHIGIFSLWVYLLP